MQESTTTDDDEQLTTERGELLTTPDEIPIETALEAIDALEEIFDDGDWWRLREAVSERAKERTGKYAYTVQDRNVRDKIQHLGEIREKREEYNSLKETFDEE